MDLKDKLSHKWRQMTLIAGVVLLSSMTVQAQNTSEQNRKETPKAYFSPKQLASALSAINADDKQADIFLEAYLQKLDPQGQISPGDLVQVFKESGIDKDEAVKMSEVLLSPQKQPSSRGYDFGSYDLSFAIDGNGNLSSLIFNGDKKIDDRDIDAVHKARCRHRGLAADDSSERFQSSQLLGKMLVRQVILEKRKDGRTVPNGDKFLQNFDRELQQNGLEIGRDGKLHGIEASKNKPLLTEKDLYNQYLMKRQQEMKKFYE